MATGKKSFVLYTDYDTIFEQLTDREAGRLVKHLFKYVNDKNPELDDRLLKILFEPIKQQLKRDLRSWETIKEKRAEIGRKGGLASAETRKQNQPIASTGKQKQANQPVTVTDNGTVTVTETVKRDRAFAPPSILEVKTFFLLSLDEDKATDEATKFFNHYESNGWKVGKNKMKKWKNAAAGWLARIPNFKFLENGQQQSTNKNLGNKSGGFGILNQALGGAGKRE